MIEISGVLDSRCLIHSKSSPNRTIDPVADLKVQVRLQATRNGVSEHLAVPMSAVGYTSTWIGKGLDVASIRCRVWQYSSECHYIVGKTMDKAVSAADANRRFSELLRRVKTGRSVVVTSHGKPVAKLSPVIEDNRAAEGARSALFARLRRERVVNAGRWTRDELYDDAP